MFRTDLNPLTGHRPNCLFSYFTIKWQVLHFCSFFSTVESHIKCICFNKSLNCFLNTVSVVINNSAQVCHVRYGSFYTKKKKKSVIRSLVSCTLSPLQRYSLFTTGVCRQSSHVQSCTALRLPPAVVGVSSVGFGHLVQLVLFLDDVAFLLKGGEQLLGEFFVHVSASVFVLPAL